MGFKDRIMNFVAPEEEETESIQQEEKEPVSPYENAGTAISAETNIALFEPRNFEEAEEIGHHIKNRRACLVNLHRMPSEYRQRIIDFLSGVIFGVDGSIKKVADNTILCSPKNLQVGGQINLNYSDID